MLPREAAGFGAAVAARLADVTGFFFGAAGLGATGAAGGFDGAAALAVFGADEDLRAFAFFAAFFAVFFAADFFVAFFAFLVALFAFFAPAFPARFFDAAADAFPALFFFEDFVFLATTNSFVASVGIVVRAIGLFSVSLPRAAKKPRKQRGFARDC